MPTTDWRTGLAYAGDGTTYLRGVDVCDLIENADFAGAAFFFMTGRRPTSAAIRLLNAVLVNFMDAGIAPSSVITRTVGSAGVPLTPSVVAGLLAIGDVQTGTGDLVAGVLQDALNRWPDRPLDEIASDLVKEHKAAGHRIPGFGHPLHGAGDPRADTLQRLVDESGLDMPHVCLARALERAFGTLKLNVVGLCAAILSDLGVDPRAVRSFTYIARSAGLTAHYLEEIDREKGWRLPVAPSDVTYDGPSRRRFEDVGTADDGASA
jgi:citrate synthase